MVAKINSITDFSMPNDSSFPCQIYFILFVIFILFFCFILFTLLFIIYFIYFILNFKFLFYFIFVFHFILFLLFFFKFSILKIQLPHFSISFFLIFNFKFTISQIQNSKCHKFQNSNIPISNFNFFLNFKSRIYKIQVFYSKLPISRPQFKILKLQIHFKILIFQYFKLPTLKFQFQISFSKIPNT